MVFSVYGHARTFITGRGHRFVEPDITISVPSYVSTGATSDDYVTNVGAASNGIIDGLLQWDTLAAAQPLIGRQNDLAVTIENTVTKGFGGESRENDRMDRTDTGTGQHQRRQPLESSACKWQCGHLCLLRELSVHWRIYILPDEVHDR